MRRISFLRRFYKNSPVFNFAKIHPFILDENKDFMLYYIVNEKTRPMGVKGA